MRLLVDMNLSPWWVTLFSGVGIEAAHWSMIGAHDAHDAPEPGRRR
jgi:predicted nuclease of predicted toxin-antitoxin system